MSSQLADLFEAVASQWWQWTAAMSVQLVLVVLVIAGLDRLLRPWNLPQLRAALWMLVVVKLVLPPTLVSPVSMASIGSSPVSAASMGSATGLEGQGWNPIPIAFAVWFVGLLAWTAVGALRYRRLRREWLVGAQPLPARLDPILARVARKLNLRHIPRVCIQHAVPGPAVVGFLRPVAVLPTELVERGSPQQIEHVLLHELAHVARRDPLVSLVCFSVQLIYWFHPLAWLARRRLALLREICCDQTVARALGGSTSGYRHTLLHMARPLLERPAVGQLGFIHGHSQLLARLQWLERPLPRGPWSRRVVSSALCSLVLLCCVPLGPRPGISLPALEDLRGCLQLRYLVYGMMGDTND